MNVEIRVLFENLYGHIEVIVNWKISKSWQICEDVEIVKSSTRRLMGPNWPAGSRIGLHSQLLHLMLPVYYQMWILKVAPMAMDGKAFLTTGNVLSYLYFSIQFNSQPWSFVCRSNKCIFKRERKVKNKNKTENQPCLTFCINNRWVNFCWQSIVLMPTVSLNIKRFFRLYKYTS
jgi:hypothetical protein